MKRYNFYINNIKFRVIKKLYFFICDLLIYQPKINQDIHNRFLSKPESNQKQKPLVNAQKIRKRGSKKIIS